MATKEGADRLAKFLEREKCKVACIHGDRSQSQRNEALQGFKDGVYRVLVATDVAARGIHVDDIAHVVNYDLPQEPENFIHRVGRTGRAGARGASWTFAIPLERSDVRNIERVLGDSGAISRTAAAAATHRAHDGCGCVSGFDELPASQPGDGAEADNTRSFSAPPPASLNL